MARRMLTLVTLLALSLTIGCSTTQKWMAGGAVVGATAGGLAGSRTYWGLGNAGEGALFGGALGATAGGLIGNIIEEKETAALLAEKDRKIGELESQVKDLEGKLAAANAEIDRLKAELDKLRKQGQGGGPVVEITLGSDVVFQSGSARLSDQGKKVLDGVAQKLKSQYAGKFIMVEGHTDADPIKVSGWKSNWELGSARSLTVLHYLEEKGVNPAQLSAATFSKYQPVAPNDTAAGKQKNRRAAIVVYRSWGGKAAAAAEPAAAAAPAKPARRRAAK